MKKSKLFLSVISLCFALTMATFGVFAAISVSYSVRGKIGYVVNDAYVEVQTNVYKVNEPISNLNTLGAAAVTTEPEYEVVDTDSYTTVSNNENGEFEVDDLVFTTNGQDPAYGYIIVINVKNLSSDINVYAYVDTLTVPTNILKYTNTKQEEIAYADTNIGENIVVALTVKDWTQNIALANGEFVIDVVIGSGDAPEINLPYDEQANLPENLAKLVFGTYDNEGKVECSVKINPENSDGTLYIPEEHEGKKVTKILSADLTKEVSGAMVQNTLVPIEYNYTNVVIPNSVENIEEGALAGCSHIQKLTIPFIGEENIEESYAYLMYGSLKTVYSSNVFGHIFGKTEFANTSYISQYIGGTGNTASFYVPDSLKEINVTNAKVIPIGAFNHLKYVEKITVPDTILDIGDSAFSYCDALKNINVPSGLKVLPMFNETAFERFVIPEGIETIGTSFRACKKLKSISIPSTATSVSFLMYDNGPTLSECFVLEELIVHPNNTRYTSRNASGQECNIIYDKIDKKLIQGCKNSVMPDDVVEIGGYAFAYQGITSVDLKSVTTIRSRAFAYCYELTEVHIPATVTTLESAFGNNPNLRTYSILHIYFLRNY